MTDIKIANKYQIITKIGGGAFGQVYKGVDVTNDNPVAIKMEPADAKPPQLTYESKMYKLLAGGQGVPVLYYYGTQDDYNVLVMDLLGPSLEDLFQICNRQFSLKTTLMLGEQMISRMEFLHFKFFMHRDQKPDNYCIGKGRKRMTVHMIDFGLAKRYWVGGAHIPYREHKSLTGTARYCSINTHLGIEQGRRDDLECMGYIFVYFLKGSLPWQGLRAPTKKQKYEKILEKKMGSPVDQLCRGMPLEYAAFLHYTRQVKFDDKPDYAFLRKMFRDLAAKENIVFDYAFDWCVNGVNTDDFIGGKRVKGDDDDDDEAVIGGEEGDELVEEVKGEDFDF